MKIPATVLNRSGDFFLQFAQTKGKVAELITYLTKQRTISTAVPPHPKNKAGAAKFQILSLSANLGAETNESGSRDERIWDGVHLYLVPHLLRGIGIETGSYKLQVCLNL